VAQRPPPPISGEPVDLVDEPNQGPRRSVAPSGRRSRIVRVALSARAHPRCASSASIWCW